MPSNHKEARQELIATIHKLVAIHQSVATRPTSVEFVVTALRDSGRNDDADMLERMAVKIRSERERSRSL